MSEQRYKCDTVGAEVGVTARTIVVEVESEPVMRPSSELVKCTHAGEAGCPVRVVEEPDAALPSSTYANTKECQYLKSLPIARK